MIGEQVTEHVTPSARPHVNPKGLYEEGMLEAELRRGRAWLRNFGALRDSVRLSGQDADARYRQIASRCQQLTEELAARTPASAVPAVVRARATDLLSLPVAPATFDPLTGAVSFGFSGQVQLGRPQEGTVIIPEGTTGSISSLFLEDDSTVVFGGDIVSAPAVGQPKEYFSLHSWTYLIPFPAPRLDSTFTYSLKIGVEVAGITMFTSASMLPTTFWSFISVGETSNFTGQDIAVNTPAGWPVIVDWPDAPYYTEYTVSPRCNDHLW